MRRRESLQLLTAAGALLLPFASSATPKEKQKSPFLFCLNTSTISGQKPGVKAMIEIAARAGYDLIELWIPDINVYKQEGKSLSSLKRVISDSGIGVANAIGFAPWLAHDEARRKAGFRQMEEEMNMLAEIGCPRVAAAPAGLTGDDPFDYIRAGRIYRELLDLGRKTGVMPQLEFWGASPVLNHLGKVLMVAAAANDPDARILADVYHLFRGDSGFEGLKMVQGRCIEIFHMNDYTGMPRESQKDKDRVYPGDGIAPLNQILNDLAKSGGTKILSLELFNEEYWKLDPAVVARTGLEKMRSAVKKALSST